MIYVVHQKSVPHSVNTSDCIIIPVDIISNSLSLKYLTITHCQVLSNSTYLTNIYKTVLDVHVEAFLSEEKHLLQIEMTINNLISRVRAKVPIKQCINCSILICNFCEIKIFNCYICARIKYKFELI